MKQEFEAKLEARGPKGAWTFLPVPFDVHAVFGTRGRVSVSGTINGFPFRNSIMPTGEGTREMMVNRGVQQGARAGAGDRVNVVMKKDDAERVVEVPGELIGALEKNKKAAAFFEGLAYSSKKEFSDWITTAKHAETKANRAAKAVKLLAAGQRRL